MMDAVEVKRPVVARAEGKSSVPAAATILAISGLGIFFWLSSARAAEADRLDSLPALASNTATDTAGMVPPAPSPPPAPAPVAPSAFFIPNSGPVTLTTNPAPFAAPVTFSPRSGYSSTPPVDPMIERMRAPALIVDFAQADLARMKGSDSATRSDSGLDGSGNQDSGYAPLPPVPTPEGEAAANGPGRAPATGAGSANDRNLSDTERFSQRVGNEENAIARAQRMTGLDRLVPQGAVLGAVMETALNSDQPGFARALTQRDVYSFDGSAILIPAGSRLIGQYKSGVAQGASRLFVLWTRLIRPDGVSIDLASPATDDLGRGGIGGKVNRHFVQRFGGAILTSVLSGGISAATASLSRGSTVFVGSAAQASSLASQATQTPDIPPTITTRQGATVRVFVARDLDFTSVGPAR